MEHTTRRGEPKLLRSCTLPLTGRGVVSRVITDLAVLDVADGGFRVVELAPGVAFADVADRTDAPVRDATPRG
jgi:3-oxoacid CoA-transferase subunit B